MRRLVLIALILAFTASTADARRRHQRGYIYLRHAPVMMVPPAAAEMARGARGRIESPAQLVPRDWQLQPPDPNWQGRRYLASTPVRLARALARMEGAIRTPFAHEAESENETETEPAAKPLN